MDLSLLQYIILQKQETQNTIYITAYFAKKCKKSDSLDEGGKTCKNAFLDL